ncbi:protein SPIRRIG-like [Andrographis paniculata]|uniref:protein SPIRRIG-like n=1 Tax=Andrographis paniculata TaxID=175694 RepID=UPI0021E89BFF|nr:protein SPIRRIG-like [Andrographis paniculata]
MKWTTLFKALRERVGISHSQSSTQHGESSNGYGPLFSQDSSFLSRDKHGSELDFRKHWEEFHSSTSEKEKEKALNWTLEFFCRLGKQQSNVPQVINMLAEPHVFAFTVGRAFVTEVEKLRLKCKTKSLEVDRVMAFFSETTKDGIRPGANLLRALEILVFGPVDKQSFLDSGIFCCLIHVLNTLLTPDGLRKRQQLTDDKELLSMNESYDFKTKPAPQLEVEDSIVHIMKALAGQPSAAQSLVDDDSLELLFQIVANGSGLVFSQYKEGLLPLHAIQLYRHSMQILGLLLINDNGSLTKYIQKHHLIKVLLMAVKDFNPDCGDPTYTLGIVELLLQSVELSYRPEAGGIRLSEDIHNAHGYNFVVHFALTLSTCQGSETFQTKSSFNDDLAMDTLDAAGGTDWENLREDGGNYSPCNISPALIRLLDIIVAFAQTGPSNAPNLSEPKTSKSSHTKANEHGRSQASSSKSIDDETSEKDNEKIKDLEAVQILQDIIIKAESLELQAEVLNRLLKIFSSHAENYKLCQQLRIVPLLILNMAGFHSSLREIILKILEYVVSVLNIIPEQELLSLCCLLQQSAASKLKHTILSFFLKLLSFDQQYKNILREVGVMELLLEDLNQNKFLNGPEQLIENQGYSGRKSSPSSYKKHFSSDDSILSSPNLLDTDSRRSLIFEEEDATEIAWDCLVSLLKKSDVNQASFRSANGLSIILPFLASDIHRPGALRVLSSLIIEDIKQTHPEELASLIDVLKTGIVTSVLGFQYTLQHDAACDTFGALWRILRSNSSAQRVFGEAGGFSLLATMLQQKNHPSITVYMKLFTYTLRVITAGACDNVVNRSKLHGILSSPTFHELLCKSQLICIECEWQFIQLMLELALEVVNTPFMMSEQDSEKNESAGLPLLTLSGFLVTYKTRVYNAAAVRVLLHTLLLFTPKVQVDLLNFVEQIACVSSFNMENLTSVGCVELLLETLYPFMLSSTPLIAHAMKIVEVLGAYRLSVSELKTIVRYILQTRLAKSGCCLVAMMERLILSEDIGSEGVSFAPFIELDTSKKGHASIQVSLGARSWPPAAGYSFVCWFQYKNFLKSPTKDTEASTVGSPKRYNLINGQVGVQVLRLFSVGAVDNGSTFYADLCLHHDGVLTLSTSNSSSLTFSGLEMEEGKWHHLAVVHTKPSALAGLFQASFAYVYLNGKLRHTGKLGYSPSPAGKSVHVTIGTPEACARVSDMSWKLRSCYLFDEVLLPGSICFMYILGRGYRGLYQDTNLLQFVPNQACGGGSMAILDSLDSDLPSPSNMQKSDANGKQGILKLNGSGFVWNPDKLGYHSLQLWGKKLIFAFGGTSTEIFRSPGNLSILNLVDPMSAAASPIGGIPRFGHLLGDAYVCKQCMISDTIRPIGGMAVVLALIEASESRDMLHMSLTLLACVLHQNPQNVRDMQKCRGYHVLALFLHQRMSMFDIKLLEIFFQISACEATFSEPRKTRSMKPTLSPSSIINEASFEDLNISKFNEEFSSVETQVDIDDFSVPNESFSHMSELENADTLTETSNCIVLSNSDMVEHVLLDWTLWVAAPVSVQISLLGFLENLVSMHWYRNHNLTILRRINLVQHLLVTLQRGDVEVPVLEHVVALLGLILRDGFLPSELENVVRFVFMTFDPPEATLRDQIRREPMGKHVIVRNMLLEMLIDLQVTIQSEELLEQWQKIVSSRLITYFLDEALHPTSMRWIMTLLGVCLSSFSTFALKFRSGGGYPGLARVLRSFYDSPDIYYILFCLMYGKPVYPRLPEVRMLDFHALMPSDGQYGELKFVELLDSVIAMAKATFDRLCVQSMVAHQTGNLSQVGASIVAELFNGHEDMAGELQGEALMHKTYAARLMGGEASSPAAATSVLRFIVDLAKMCPPFSAICRRAEFLESCIDLYFSCVRAFHAVDMAKELTLKSEDKNLNDLDEIYSSPNSFSSLPPEHEQSSKISITVGSFAQGNVTVNSEEIPIFHDDVTTEKPVIVDLEDQHELDKKVEEDLQAVTSADLEAVDQLSSATSCGNELNFRDILSVQDHIQANNSENSRSFTAHEASTPPESSDTKISLAPSPDLASKSSLGGASHNDSKFHPSKAPSVDSFMSVSETDFSSDFKFISHAEYAPSTAFAITPKLLLEVDSSGYGGGPCSAGATAVLDFMAEVLSDFVTEQMKAIPVLETVLESVPLHVDSESFLAFQGLCLTRLMNFLERRLLRDDEENEKKLDKNRWSVNLDALSWMIVDRVYMGAFPQSGGLLKTLEFLLSMLQLANKDGRIEEIIPSGKGFLSLARGSRQLDTYVQALIKNMNRMILFCFLPSFLYTIGEDNLLAGLGMQNEPRTKLFSYSSPEDGGIDIITVLQLLIAHRRIIFCPTNRDTDLFSCLCVNLISLLRDHRKHIWSTVIDILKYFLVHRKVALEEFLVSKSSQGQTEDLLQGGFNKLLTGNISEFFEWFHSSETIINKVMEQGAAVMWRQYVAGATKFPSVRIKALENRRSKEMGRKSKDLSTSERRHWEILNERRNSLQKVHDVMATELRVTRQDRYGWVVHAESEWQAHHLQQLVHERGIFPVKKSSRTKEELEWQLCSIEGPYRMRKRLERCRAKIDTIQNVLEGQFEKAEEDISKENTDYEHYACEIESDTFFNIAIDKPREESFRSELYNEPTIRESGDAPDIASSSFGWNDDLESSINEASLHSAAESGFKSSDSSSLRTETRQGKSDLGSSRLSAPVNVDELRVSDDRSDKDLNDKGENLIRPYLEPFEKIKHKYNCERVAGLDKYDGIFVIGESSLYIIENFYIEESGCVCEKESEEELSIIDQALGVQKDISGSKDSHSKSNSSWGANSRGRAWAFDGGVWGRENLCCTGNMPHHCRLWKLDSVRELLKRDYQLRPVAIEIFSVDGCNGLLVFHKKEREEVFRNLLALNLPRNNTLDATITGSTKQESNEGGRLYKTTASSLSKRWQNGEISNFQYIMHLNTLAGRGYSDLTQYPVFPWILADYESVNLDLSHPNTFRNLQKPMGCQTSEGEEEFRRRYESWDDPEIPKFHYGSHYSSAGIVLFYLLRLPPFSSENQKLQGGQFDHADRLFNSIPETWLSAAGRGNTSDVKELIPEFFYLPEFLENKFDLDFGEKQSGEKVGDVVLPPWAKGSPREFIRKHREALECDYVSEHLHHWIDLIFGSKQRGKAAEEAANVFYHYTYEGSVDIDSIADPVMKASILAQINHFGQTPKQLFLKPHVKRRTDRKLPPHPLRHSAFLVPHEIRKSASSISQIVIFNDKILITSTNHLLKPRSFTKCIAWGFPDRTLRFMSYNQDRLLSTHEDLHSGSQIQCVAASQDGKTLVTGGDDSLVCVWRLQKEGLGPRAVRRLHLERSLCGHTGKVTCLHVSQPYMIIVSGSDDCAVILWDLSSLTFLRQLPEFPSPISAIFMNDLTGEITTAAGAVVSIWSINGDCLAVVNASQLVSSGSVLSLVGSTFSDWQETNWCVSGHQGGDIRVWKVSHCSSEECGRAQIDEEAENSLKLGGDRVPEYRLILHKVLKSHKFSVTALRLSNDLKQLLSGDSGGHLLSWTLRDESFRSSMKK